VVVDGDLDGEIRVEQDVGAVLAALDKQLRKLLAQPENAAEWFVAHGDIAGGDNAPASWRVMFARALLDWEEQKGSKQ
jgi:hypothetical protein